MIISITANATTAFESPTLIKLSPNHPLLTMISIRKVALGKDPNGTYFSNELSANLFLSQTDFATLAAAVAPGSSISVTLKYDDTINISLKTNATEFDFGSPPTVCLLKSVPVVNFMQPVISAR